MDSKKSIELIILEVLGCLHSDDRSNLQLLKDSDENFPWRTLAEFQNLSALLPSVLNISELPSVAAKEVMINKLNGSISSDYSQNQPAKFTPGTGKKNEENQHLEEILAKNKIDWGSLSVPNPNHETAIGYEEVKPKNIAIDRDSTQYDDKVETTEDLEFVAAPDEKEINITTSAKLKKYVMISIILFVISLVLFGYLFIFKQTEKSEMLAENKSQENLVSAPVEEFIYNDIQDSEIIQQTADVQQDVIETKSETNTETKLDSKTETKSIEDKKNVLPKAPPKLPEPIEAPLIETVQTSSTEEAKLNEEISAPPPKEVIEETEEPTYFVAVEEMPEPIGGLKAIQEKIVYPELAKRAGVQGKVYIRAFVDEKGNVTNAEVVKGIGGGCDEAALDAILKTKFTPGKQRGKPIKVQVTVPVLFKL